MLGDRADHVQRDDRDPDRAELLGRRADFAAHDRARKDEHPGAWQVRDGPHRGGDLLLADERDRVDGDPLAAEVVAVRLADRPQRDLGDLGAAADHDHPLAEDRPQRAGQMDGDDRFEAAQRVARFRPRDALDLELDLDASRRRSRDPRRTALSVRKRPPALATSRRGRDAPGSSASSMRTATIARRRRACVRPRARSAGPAAGGPGPRSPTRSVGLGAGGRVVLLEGEAEGGEGLARGGGVVTS